MTIKPVTSLADLEFKAKTDKHYQQLTILGCAELGYPNIKVYANAIKRLHKISINHNPDSCQTVINYVNRNCNRIKPEKNKVSELMKKKEVAKIVENLKKFRKKAVSRKAVKKVKRRVSRRV